MGERVVSPEGPVAREERMMKFQGMSFSRFVAAAGLAVVALPVYAQDAQSDPYSNLPASIELIGVVRDFKERSAAGGHPDFERQPTRGFAHYAYICADQLDQDGKPVWASSGRKVTAQWRDASNRNITPPRAHIASRPGDQAGSMESVDGGATTTASNFAQWWRDVPGVNVSMQLPIRLVRNPGTNIYTFNDRTDPQYSSLGGFFPINGQLYGNSAGDNKNFHFTFELDTQFVYKRGAGQVFTFTGDDDVFVFIDGKCVIDIGGVHAAVTQTIDLDRLEWLEDNKKYNLKFFFAERHRTQSNFRIDTTLQLQNVQLPVTAGLAD